MEAIFRKVRAFALIEVVIALILMGIVGGSAFRGIAFYHHCRAQNVTKERLDIICRAFCLCMSQEQQGFIDTMGCGPMASTFEYSTPISSGCLGCEGICYIGPIPQSLGLPDAYCQDGYGHDIICLVPFLTPPQKGVKAQTALFVPEQSFSWDQSTQSSQNKDVLIVLLILKRGAEPMDIKILTQKNGAVDLSPFSCSYTVHMYRKQYLKALISYHGSVS